MDRIVHADEPGSRGAARPQGVQQAVRADGQVDEVAVVDEPLGRAGLDIEADDARVAQRVLAGQQLIRGEDEIPPGRQPAAGLLLRRIPIGKRRLRQRLRDRIVGRQTRLHRPVVDLDVALAVHDQVAHVGAGAGKAGQFHGPDQVAAARVLLQQRDRIAARPRMSHQEVPRRQHREDIGPAVVGQHPDGDGTVKRRGSSVLPVASSKTK